MTGGVDAETLRRRLHEIGFDAVGFAAANQAASSDRFKSWLKQGFAGSMDYLSRRIERRLDPREVVKGAKSVIVTANHYHDGKRFGIASARSDVAEIASYARGDDYHRVIEKRLKLAVAAISEMSSGSSSRYYVDTGPVLERDWAEMAGIGWVGKNTCTIQAGQGSFLFLGAVITTLAIPPDRPAPNHCGTCNLCIEACPTDAFVGPYELDARRCISYLTIEHRGDLDEALEPQIGSLVFGCDICQEVCPHNRPQHLRGDGELASRPENVWPDLVELSELTEERFRERFRGSAVKRAKFSGFLRNVIIALGNCGTERCYLALERLRAREDVRASNVLLSTLERALKRSSR